MSETKHDHSQCEPGTDLEPAIEAAEGGDMDVRYMNDRECLEEIVRNTRETRDNTRAMLAAVEQIVSQVGEAMNNPMLGGMLKMFGRR